MRTTARTKPIDLSKCSVGQRVKLRNGEEAKFQGRRPKDFKTFPFAARLSSNEILSYKPDGRYYEGEESNKDIVAILPLPKKAGKKKAPERLQKALAAFDTIDAPTVRRCIKLLEGLLKP